VPDLIVPASEQGSEMSSDPPTHSAGSIDVCRVGFFPAPFTLDFFHAIGSGKPIGDGATVGLTMDSGGQELGYGGAGLHRGVDEEREVDVEVFNLDSDANEDVCARNGTDSPGKDTREHLSHHCGCRKARDEDPIAVDQRHLRLQPRETSGRERRRL
jgi:hypothetical protein